MGLALVVALISVAAVGFVLGRSLALAPPIAVVPMVYVGADRGWWGNGLGDGWYFTMAAVLVVAFAVTGAGIAMRRLLA